jgi:hypothetical protein
MKTYFKIYLSLIIVVDRLTMPLQKKRLTLRHVLTLCVRPLRPSTDVPATNRGAQKKYLTLTASPFALNATRASTFRCIFLGRAVVSSHARALELPGAPGKA